MRLIYILLLLMTTLFSAFAEPQTWSAYFAQKKALFAGYVKNAASRLGLWTFATPIPLDEIEKNIKQAYGLFSEGNTDLSEHPLKKMWQKNKRALNRTWKSNDPKENLFNVIENFLNEAERYNEIAKEKTPGKRREDFLNKDKGFVCLDIVDSSYNRALGLIGKARQDNFDTNKLKKTRNTQDTSPSLVIPILAGYTAVGIASYCAAPYIFQALQESDAYTPEIKTLAAGLAVSAVLAHHPLSSEPISQ